MRKLDIAAAAFASMALASCSLLFPEKDTAEPTVTLTAPSAGPVSGLVEIAAAASDDTGVFKVVFYVDQVLVGTDTSSPYSCSWNSEGAGTGTHLVSAKAYDDAGNMGVSSYVSVTTST